jgi:carbon monoxide dehydrogenase subunit G
VQIGFERSIALAEPVEAAWQFLSDVQRVADCIPNISDLAEMGAGDYTARASDRVGPFRVSMKVALAVETDPAGRTIRADLRGHDLLSQTRVAASVRAACEASEPGSSTISITAEGEVLGPVATLGAGPIRRRLDEIFEQFVRVLETRIGSSEAGGPLA